MWPYHPELLERPVPRYTSFPTAAEFAPDVLDSDHAEALERVEGAISLYVHIPFCHQICWYCGCNTAAANRAQRLQSYLDALHREIMVVAALLPDDVRVGRIAFGGGSPNAISPDQFLDLFDAIKANFTLGHPIVSIEFDPRSLDDEWGRVVRRVGATHASLGVQTFAPHCQEAIGRIQPYCMIERSVRLLRAAGITSLNFDLMYGLPGQTMGDLDDSLGLAAGYEADRIALFGYAHVPHLIPRQRRIDASALPDKETRFAMAEHGYHSLTSEGYVPVGFDHFARPADPLAWAARGERLRRNFQGFTDDPAEVLVGLGASAISNFPHLLVQNEKNAGRYRMLLSQDRLPVGGGVRRKAEDRRRARVIEALLCRDRAQIDPDLWQDAAERLAPYLDAGLCRRDGDELAIVPGGLPYARSIAAAFDPYRQDSPRRFSSAV